MIRLGKLWLTLMLVAAFASLGGVVRAQNTQDFIITNFKADYYLDRNQSKTSTLRTVENIQTLFPSYDQNHGILRAIPETYQGHTVSLRIDSVTDENNIPLNYTTYSENDNLVLKIGDADTYVHGAKTYKITYDTKNVISILANHDEFYWDVNGDQWQQPFPAITANLHISPEISSFLDEQTQCYPDADDAQWHSRGQCSISAPQKDGRGSIISASATKLVTGDTLTIVAGFDQGTFELGPEIAQAKHAQFIKHITLTGLILAPPILSAIYLYNRWRKYGRDPKGRGIIIPEYQPPKGLNALTSDYVLREDLNNKAITALILELAIRKYLTIYEFKQKKKLAKDTTGYSLKLIKDPSGLSDEERQVITMFFDDSKVGTEVKLADLKNKLAASSKSLRTKLGERLLAAGYFSNNPNRAGSSYYTIGGLLTVSGFFFVIFVLPWIGLSIGLTGLIFLLTARYMPARSQAGAAVRDHMLGLRDYIKLAEADRLKFLQSPEGAEKIKEFGLAPNDPKFKVKLFESLLPYAMLFNLEKDWAKQFQDLYRDAPSWYAGNWSTFNTAYLASSLGGFNSASAVTFTSPSSSGSSGFGGGFSGGGGGGGGGGGW